MISKAMVDGCHEVSQEIWSLSISNVRTQDGGNDETPRRQLEKKSGSEKGAHVSEHALELTKAMVMRTIEVSNVVPDAGSVQPTIIGTNGTDDNNTSPQTQGNGNDRQDAKGDTHCFHRVPVGSMDIRGHGEETKGASVTRMEIKTKPALQ